MPDIVTFSPEQTQELDELYHAVNAAVIDGGNRECIVIRHNTIELEGDILTVGQELRSSLPNRGTGTPVPEIETPQLDEVFTNDWFRRNINGGKYSERMYSTLRIEAPYPVTSDTGLTWYPEHFIIPALDYTADSTSHVGLVDPFEKQIVPYDDVDYEGKWARITSWMLDQLDDASRVTITSARFDNSEVRQFDDKGLASDSVCTVSEISRDQIIQGEPERVYDVLARDWVTLLFSYNSHQIVSMNVGPGIAEVTDYDITGDQEAVGTNPYDYDPELVRRLTGLILQVSE